MKERLGEQIRYYREQKNWTQSQLAEAAGVSTTHLSSIERGSYYPSLPVFLKLASALEASTDMLLCFSVENKFSTEQLDREFATLLETCSYNQRMYLLQVLSAVKTSLNIFE